MSTFSRDLLPLKKPHSVLPFSVCDIEARDWKHFLVIGHFDGKTFTEYRRLPAFLDFLFQRPEEQVFAHFGGIYDFMFLLQAALRSGRFEVENLIPRGSGILCFTLSNGQRKIIFRDSSALLPFSLKSLTDSFDVKSKKQTIDYTRIKKVTPRLIEYLTYDCRGLYEVLSKFFSSKIVSRSGPKFTVAGQSLQLFRTFLQTPVQDLAPSYDSFVRQAYSGGRTEIFRPLYRGRTSLFTYDVNSLYPAVMRENEFPNQCEGFSSRFDRSKMGFVEATVSVPENTYVPFLWVKKVGRQEKFLFPVGVFSGVWSIPELTYAEMLGVKILKTAKCLYFSNGGKLFESFVNYLYEYRRNSKDPTENIIAKLLLNSSYGRMGLQRSREGLEWDNGQEGVKPSFEVKLGRETYRFVKTKVELKTFSNVAIAAYVTAYARILMHRKYLLPAQSEIYYTDTDSLFTTRRFPTGDGIGELKLEYRCRRACFLLPKTYVAGSKVAMKGFDKKKIQHFTVDDFTSALEGDLRRLKIKTPPRFARLKTALKAGKFLYLTKPSVKQVQSAYTKREVFWEEKTRKWETRPLVLDITSKEEKRK